MLDLASRGHSREAEEGRVICSWFASCSRGPLSPQTAVPFPGEVKLGLQFSQHCADVPGEESLAAASKLSPKGKTQVFGLGIRCLYLGVSLLAAAKTSF